MVCPGFSIFPAGFDPSASCLVLLIYNKLNEKSLMCIDSDLEWLMYICKCFHSQNGKKQPNAEFQWLIKDESHKSVRIMEIMVSSVTTMNILSWYGEAARVQLLQETSHTVIKGEPWHQSGVMGGAHISTPCSNMCWILA